MRTNTKEMGEQGNEVGERGVKRRWVGGSQKKEGMTECGQVETYLNRQLRCG